jgi:hypothetical protein
VVAAALIASHPARADTDYFAATPQPDGVTVRRNRSRCPRQKALIGSLLGGAVIVGGVGLYAHLQSRSASSDVAAIGGSTGLTWTEERQATFDRAVRDRTLAIIGYGVGSALLVGAALALVFTDPGSETISVAPDEAAPPPVPLSLTLLPNGAFAEAGWQW